MSLILIAAMAPWIHDNSKFVIGDSKTNGLPWPKIEEDLKRFRNLTLGAPVIMGKATYESLGNKPLPDRTNIIVSSTLQHYIKEDLNVFRSVHMAIRYSQAIWPDSFVIGGQEIYKETLPMADMMELTILKKAYDGDRFFPNFSECEWQRYKEDKREEYSFCSYIRLGKSIITRR
jgi:dihydrofolate reductase